MPDSTKCYPLWCEHEQKLCLDRVTCYRVSTQLRITHKNTLQLQKVQLANAFFPFLTLKDRGQDP